MDSDLKYENLKNWVVDQFIACENDTLTDKQRTLFLDLVEERKDDKLINDAFKTFMEYKMKMKFQK